MDKELRKGQILLVEAGVGVILFAVWNITRVNLYLGLAPIPVEAVYEEAVRNGIGEKLFLIVMIAVLAVILIWQLSIRLYIGMSAIAEGKGKKKGCAYLVWAAVLLVSDFQINWQAFDGKNIPGGGEATVNQIISMCLEAASAYVLLQLLIFGIRVKKLRKKMKA